MRPRRAPRVACGIATLAAFAACAGGTPGASKTTTSTGSRSPSAGAAAPAAPSGGRPGGTGALTAPATPAPTGPPAAGLQARLAGRDWERVPTSQRVVALTFDAGANADAVTAVLATLAREHVPATFFVTATFVRAFPDAARRLAATGDPVGNHSVDHPHFPQLADTEVRAQVTQAEATIRSVLGVSPRPLFRFPYGDRTAHDIALVNDLGYVPVRWTVDTLGWQGTSGGMSASRVVARVLAVLQPGQIVLMHLGSHPTDHSTLDADALPALVSALRDRGYGFVTLRALTG